LTPLPPYVLALFCFGIGSSGAAAALAAPCWSIAERFATALEDESMHPPTSDSPVRQALREGSYPWYDPGSDRVKPVGSSWLRWPRERLAQWGKAIGRFLDGLHFGRMPSPGMSGDSIGTMLLLAVLVAFFIALFVLWFRLDGMSMTDGSGQRTRLGTAARLAQLPEGIRPGGDDPWAEALARRAAGDLAGAVVCLFAHQLLTLEELGLIRLAPGRTARQYVQALRDPDFLDSLVATQGLFEDVYYGRRRPSLEAFETVWSRAEAFQERRSLLGALR
jgi:hypothetical protein